LANAGTVGNFRDTDDDWVKYTEFDTAAYSFRLYGISGTLQAGGVPEPGTLAIWAALGTLGIAASWLHHRRIP
jgi:hypothetical protein